MSFPRLRSAARGAGERPTRAAVAVGLAAALCLAAWHLPGSIRRLDNLVAVAGRQSRQLPAASLYGIDASVFDRAAAVIPADAVYAVATPPGTDLASLAFPGLAGNRLLPRRRTLDPKEARWVLAYRVDPHTLGVPLGRVERLGPDVQLAERAG